MPLPFLTTPENQSARIAIQDFLNGLVGDSPEETANLLYVHGPSGTGKTHLMNMLVDDLTHHPTLRVCMISANEFADQENSRSARVKGHDLQKEADLLIIEDLQHLPTRCAESLVQIIDERNRRRLPTVVTALVGPAQLSHRGTTFGHRLTTRLGSGLVVALLPLQAAGRRQRLTALAQQNALVVADDILDWLAEHLTGGGRQLEGAIHQVKKLQRLQKKPLRLDELRKHFREQIDATAPTVERIAEHVCKHYHVEQKRLRSEKRSHDVLLPRQVVMYLARQLTPLSLKQIGSYFGGRDHRTVQHACAKVADAMETDRQLAGVVKQMQAELA